MILMLVRMLREVSLRRKEGKGGGGSEGFFFGGGGRNNNRRKVFEGRVREMGRECAGGWVGHFERERES